MTKWRRPRGSSPMSPEYCRPPSAMSGTPRTAGLGSQVDRGDSWDADAGRRGSCRSSRGPRRPLTASTPASMSAWAPSVVATLPADDVDASNGSALMRRITEGELGAAVRGVDDDVHAGPARAVARLRRRPSS